MAKVKNQKFYGTTVYGSEVAGGAVRLESTEDVVKGPVELVGTLIAIITGGFSGFISHANTANRSYSLPDVDGEFMVGGLFTNLGDMLYASAPGVLEILPVIVSSALTSNAGGIPTWQTGVNGQILTMVAGSPAFADIPSNIGTIADALAGNTLPMYLAAGNDLGPLVTVAGRVLLSPAGVLTWALITASYLSTTAGAPLPNGTVGDILSSLGDGSFAWATPNPSVINTGALNFIPYYSVNPTGNQISASAFFALNESVKALTVFNEGSLRLYEATVNGVNYIGLKAPNNLTAITVFTLPAVDGAPGNTLITNGAGVLSFTAATGTIAPGVTNDMPYYAASGNALSPLSTVAGRTLTSPLGVPTWSLLTETYFSTTGAIPLSAGALNQALVSDGGTNFLWATIADIVGFVGVGALNNLAYYPAAGTAVAGAANLLVSTSTTSLDFKNQWALRLFELTVNGTDYVEFKAPANLAASASFVVPGADGNAGDFLQTDGLGNMSFQKVVTEERGFLTLGLGAAKATVAFDVGKFATPPNVVDVQWKVTGTSSPSLLPTLAVDNITVEGMVVRFSSTTPLTGVPYGIAWSAAIMPTASLIAKAYTAGGEDGASTLFTSLRSILLDVDTTAPALAASFGTGLARSTSVSSDTKGFILGGDEGAYPGAPVSSMRTLAYVTETLAVLGSSLTAPRSDASGVGTTSVGYMVGGVTTGPTVETDIQRVDLATDVASVIAPGSVTNAVRGQASFCRATSGFTTHSGLSLGSIGELTYLTETYTVTPESANNYKLACNNVAGDIGYLATATTTQIDTYIMTSGTLAILPASLSTTGAFASFNSLDSGYFAPTASLERLDFATGTITAAINTYPVAPGAIASASTFQTRGLL